MGLLPGGGGQTLHILEQDEGKSSGAASVRIRLQVDVLDFSEGPEVLLDVCVLRFLEIMLVSSMLDPILDLICT